MGDTLLAARDPRGWRPLAMGRLGDAVVFASETCALDIVGATYERDVEPGEIVSVDGDGVQSSHPLPKQESRRCVFEYVYFARPDSRVYGGSVDRARRALGKRLAREHPAPGRRSGVQRPRFVELGGARLRRRERPAVRARAHPQSLCGADLHPAHAGGARREGQGQVQSGARDARRQERRDGRRLDRARHDDARPRRAGARRRRARGAHARQLAAGHRSLLLRHRHAVARGADRGEQHRRRRSPRTWAWTRSAICRSTECWSQCRRAQRASATPVSPATIRRRRRPDPDKLRFGCGC